jgi:capsular polysaccharide transport system ATP-binding protein
MSAITLGAVSLDIHFGSKRVSVLRNASFTFPVRKMALIAESRSNVVAVLDMLSRRLVPQAGQLRYAGRVSWPIGHTAPFSVAITGTQAVSHLATLYNLDRDLALDFLRAEFEVPEQLPKPILSWSRLHQTKFMMLMALVPTFDVYLVDGNLILPEDAAFSRRFLQMFLTRTHDSTVLITARQSRVVRMICDGAVVLRDGKLEFTEDIDAALALSNRIPNLEVAEVAPESTETDDGFLF